MTRQVALIGKPLKRRHSQVMHDAAFDAAGIDARYVLMELEPDEVEPAVRAARGPDWLGLGVTAPYKRVVAGLVDEVEEDAERIGAVNNVVRTDDGRLVGFNTDAPGFRAGVELAMGRPLGGHGGRRGGRRWCGARGRVRVPAAGAGRVTIGNRTASAADELARRFAGVGDGAVVAVGLDDPAFADALRSADLAVNATTVGMIDTGRDDRRRCVAGRRDRLRPRLRSAGDAAAAAARARGLRAANGSEMLIQQAAIAFERWTGVGGMADVMRAAVAPLLADATVRA